MASPRKSRPPFRIAQGRLGYENRMHAVLCLLSLPTFALAALGLWHLHATRAVLTGATALLLLGWVFLQAWLVRVFLRPVQTLSNVVAAMREGDYSFRLRGGRRGDALGDLTSEINALAEALQVERVSFMESAALVRRVLESIDAPVLAFDQKGILRLLNPAAARVLRGDAERPLLGRHARELGLEHVVLSEEEQVATLGSDPRATQWIVRRSRFRESGVSHLLLLLSDVSTVLREEERQAWQRLIRVLGHEINNSLTPIKSLAGSMRGMAARGAELALFDRPLEVIEERAQSLQRFLVAYRTLAQLPPPELQPVSLGAWLRQLAALEVRVPVVVEDGPAITLMADKDQLAQAIVNLLRNAADAALANPARTPRVVLSWQGAQRWATLRVLDSGLGIANPGNLFVPFYTTKEQGSGIGLVLVKQIVEGHNGSIVLRNHPEGGAVAELRLPL